LAQQINQGAPADVFASASQTTMDQVVQAGEAASSTAFAKNIMEIAVPPTNPAAIAGLSDLAKPGVKVALCQSQVPCGSVAAKVFANAKVTVTPVTQEADVKAVLTKVQLGEVDAGLVYVTDVKAAGDQVKGIAIAGDVNASTSYPIAALTKAPNHDAAAAFVAYVMSAEGKAVLTAGGFAAP
jgi:molybdate transport system substrate-binding protein